MLGTPVGVSSALLVQSAGGDVKLANQLVVVISVVKGLGLL